MLEHSDSPQQLHLRRSTRRLDKELVNQPFVPVDAFLCSRVVNTARVLQLGCQLC